ncbi:MAG: DciA family protein [Desulfomonilaceae bacterium]
MKQRERSYPKPAGSVLFETFRQMGLSSALARQSIVARWPNIVDSVVTRHARAERLMGDTLYVVVDSSVWMNELSAIKMVLLEKLNSKLGRDVPKIKDIKFRQISWRHLDVNPTAPSSRGPATTLPPDEVALKISTRSIHAIKNAEIRDIVERLIQKDARYKANRPSIK